MKPDISALRDDCQHILRTSGDVSQRHWATTCLSVVSLLEKTQIERDGYRWMLDERGDALATARCERDAIAHAADRFLSCLGEFDGDSSFCNEYATALEAAICTRSDGG